MYWVCGFLQFLKSYKGRDYFFTIPWNAENIILKGQFKLIRNKFIYAPTKWSSCSEEQEYLV